MPPAGRRPAGHCACKTTGGWVKNGSDAKRVRLDGAALRLLQAEGRDTTGGSFDEPMYRWAPAACAGGARAASLEGCTRRRTHTCGAAALLPGHAAVCARHAPWLPSNLSSFFLAPPQVRHLARGPGEPPRGGLLQDSAQVTADAGADRCSRAAQPAVGSRRSPRLASCLAPSCSPLAVLLHSPAAPPPLLDLYLSFFLRPAGRACYTLAVPPTKGGSVFVAKLGWVRNGSVLVCARCVSVGQSRDVSQRRRKMSLQHGALTARRRAPPAGGAPSCSSGRSRP